MALAGEAFDCGEFEVGVALLVGFHGVLRSGEIGNALLGDFSLNASGSVLTLDLGFTKGGVRRRVRESVATDDPVLIKLLQVAIERGLPGDLLVLGGTTYLRKVFNLLLKKLGLQGRGYLLYSLRRGGATSMFRAIGNLGAVLVRGRWQSQKTARQYIDSDTGFG